MAEIERGATAQLEGLTPHPKNYNAHPPEQVEELRRSLRTFGQVRDVVTWQQYVIAGHGVVEAARLEGWTEISATRLPDDWPEERVLAYLAADNETARLSRPDEAQLAALLKAVPDEKLRALAAGGEARLRALLRPAPPEDKGQQIDRAAELQEKWQVQRGQVWEIPSKTVGGRCHRLMCGDSTSGDDVAKLMGGDRAKYGLHDPPYGIEVVGAAADSGGSKGFGSIGFTGKVLVNKYRPVEGDDRPFDPSHLLKASDFSVLWGGNYYADKLPPMKGWIVWDKKGREDWRDTFSDCELAWTNLPIVTRIIRHTWMGMVQEGEREKRFHPTQKPVGLFVKVMGLFEEGATVIDYHSGVGTTIIACEQTGRIGYGMEIHPPYCAVSLQRLADMGLETRLAQTS
jgi:hypothetical protein